MANSSSFPHIFSPLTIGPKIVPHRIFVSGHQPTMAVDGLPSEQYIAYQRTRARGGAALQITGATSVHHTGYYTASHGSLVNLDDRIIPGYQRLADAVHEEGGLMLAQLAHAGQTIQSVGPGSPAWAPSALPSQLVKEVPHEMTVAEIAEVVDAFGAAAVRVRQGGLDGVEILAAFGLLVSAFLSPYSNKRTDDYGGSLDNRLRFVLEVVDAVRSAVGSDLIVGMRIPGDELVKGGLEIEEMQTVAKRLEATGKVDYLNVIAGTNLDRIERAMHWAPTPSKFGRFVHLASAIREVVDLPVFTVGRVVNPQHAEEILAAGHADMVGMTRAHIADPDLVRKLRAGRLEDIRPCVGANVCISHAMTGSAITCMHNPSTGREVVWPQAEHARKPKRILVIGGGPAGLETARIAAERGHRVELFEKEQTVGGQLRQWASVPTMGEYQQVIDWRVQQLEKLDVTMHLGETVSAEHPALEHADVVVIATGSKPHVVEIPTVDSTVHVATPHAVIDEVPAHIKHALIWDEAGSQVAVSAAESLQAQGAKVTFVTSGYAIGDDLNITHRVPLFKRLFEHGAEMIATHRVVRIEGDNVVLENVFSQAERVVGGVDLVVSWQGNRVVEAFSAELTDRNISYHIIGDSVSPRSATIAFAEAAQLARQL